MIEFIGVLAIIAFVGFVSYYAGVMRERGRWVERAKAAFRHREVRS